MTPAARASKRLDGVLGRRVVAAWDAGAAEDTLFAGSNVRAVYEAPDTAESGARQWVDDLAVTPRPPRSGSIRRKCVGQSPFGTLCAEEKPQFKTVEEWRCPWRDSNTF